MEKDTKAKMDRAFLMNVWRSCSQLADIKASIGIFLRKKDSDEKDIRLIESDLSSVSRSNNRDIVKNLKSLITIHQTELNQYISSFEKEISSKIVEYLFGLEHFKVDGILPSHYCDPVRWAFIALTVYGGRLHVRYLKLPKSWIPLGFLAGVLEELVVIMRTASQLGISDNHLITLDQLIGGLKKSYADDPINEDRFLFMTKLLSLPTDQIVALLKSAIDSQGKARRISMYTDPTDQTVYYYSIQGLLGHVKFDPRVVKDLTPDNTPPFAVHFTKKEVALKIWNKEETVAKRNRDGALVVGAICRFDRHIHALTNIEFVDGHYRIVTVDKDIRDRMTHGIKDTDVRPKYESGLVIDLKKLVEDHKDQKGIIQINEIGTLLVQIDIPHEYILACLNTDEDIAHFWSA